MISIVLLILGVVSLCFLYAILLFLLRSHILSTILGFAPYRVIGRYEFFDWANIWLSWLLWEGFKYDRSKCTIKHFHDCGNDDIKGYMKELGYVNDTGAPRHPFRLKHSPYLTAGDTILRKEVEMMMREAERTNSLGRSEIEMGLRSAFELRSVLFRLRKELKTIQLLPDGVTDRSGTKPPLIICGLPRTGSSLLHNILSCDDNVWLPSRAELICPENFIEAAVRQRVEAGVKDDEIYILPEKLRESTREKEKQEDAAGNKENQRIVKELLRVSPDILSAYPWILGGRIEDIWILNRQGVNHILSFMCGRDLQEYFAALPDALWEDIYREFRELYSAFLQLRPCKQGGFCVLKAQNHVVGLTGMMKVFPTANVVVLHRNPLVCLSSCTSMYTILGRKFYTAIDTNYLAKNQCRRMEIITDKMIQLNKHNPRIMHVRYDDLVREGTDMIEAIYKRFGYTYSSEFHNKATSWLNSNPQGKHGRHKYSCEKYGLDKNGLKEKFSKYAATFDIDLDNFS